MFKITVQLLAQKRGTSTRYETSKLISTKLQLFKYVFLFTQIFRPRLVPMKTSWSTETAIQELPNDDQLELLYPYFQMVAFQFIFLRMYFTRISTVLSIQQGVSLMV